MTRIGFIGVGLMGSGMASNLLKAGFDVTLWDRSREHTGSLIEQGAAFASLPSEVGAACDTICLSLPNGQVVDEVLFGQSGALTGVKERTVVDHSTISPSDASSLASKCGETGNVFLSGPVGGGPEASAAGKLAIFLGGDEAAAKRVDPVIRSYSDLVVYFGQPAAAQVAKLANQLCLAGAIQGITEAFRLASAADVDLPKLLSALQVGYADSVMLRKRVPVPGLEPGEPASNGWKPGFTADFMAKDLDFALAEAKTLGVDVPLTNFVRGLLSMAQADGHGHDDWTIVSQYHGGEV